MATRELVVNMVPGGATPVIHVSQYDDGYGITANLIENGGTYTVPVGATVSIEGTKPDGHGYAYLCTYQDNAVVIPVNTQMTAVKGKHPCELVVRKDGLRVGSKNMIMAVEVAGLGEDTIISDTELPAIIALAQEQEEAAASSATEAAASATQAASSAASAETAKDAAIEAAETAQAAEAWAVGQRDGVDVPSTDETYHNNSKYYAGQAGTAASSAASSATSASSSASSASSSASNASSSKTAAANSATAAASSASQARTSATQAASSAASAETAKDAAMDAAQDAIDAAQELQTAIQFNAALIHETASGAVASFADGADNIPMQSLVAEITPVQSGSGDPSPTNIRPISGRTGLTVTRAGKNLFDQSDTTYLSQDSRAYAVSDDRAVAQINRLPAGTYTLSFIEEVVSLNEIEPSATRFGLFLRATSGEQEFIVRAQTGLITPTVGQIITKTVTFTLTDEYVGKFQYFYVYTGKKESHAIPNTYTANIHDVQIELGSTATAYEHYTAQEYPISWQTQAGTIYGGTLDVVSGVLTVDKVLTTFDGTESRWSVMDGQTGKFDNANINVPPQYNYSSDILFNKYKTGVSYSQVLTGDYIAAVNKTRLLLADSRYTTVDEFKASLASEPLTVLLPLATPQTYQLTGAEVRTILGENLVYSDAGDVSVEYIADTKMYIDNKIAELQALVLEN